MFLMQGFRNRKGLKDHLVRPHFIVKTDTLGATTADENLKINKSPFNCNTEKSFYVSECTKLNNPYVGKAQTKFRMRLNVYKSAHK